MDEFNDRMIEPNVYTSPSKWWFISFAIVSFVSFILLLVAFLITAPGNFPTDQSIFIKPGLSAAEITTEVKKTGAVRSSTLLYAILVTFHDPSNIKAGAYAFSEPLNVFGVAARLAEDVPQADLVTLTFPEGYSVHDYSVIAGDTLSNFDQEYFYEQARGYEGYLFPDTYFVPTDFTADSLIELLRNAYKQKTESYRKELITGAMSEEAVITLASIVEREANSPESMRIVAGILKKRLAADMPLQVDASMEYILDKPLKELTAEDLTFDSPYNTYLYRGLPPTPIGNPGLTAITAVLEPEETDYWYYITDNEGEFHYARTLAEHNQNIARYLR